MITGMITSGQDKQLKRVISDGLDKIIKNLTKAQAEQLLKVGNLLQDDLARSFRKRSIVDKRFGADLLKGKGTFTVPADYNHDTQIDDFGVKTKDLKSTYYYNPNLTSKNFAGASNKLVPGKTYAIKMFWLLGDRISSKDCLAFLKENNAILVGAQGLTALHTDQPEIFPIGKYTVSFDEKEALLKDADGYHRVPDVGRESDGDRKFRLGYFANSWYSVNVLVCFCDLESLEA